MKSTVNNHVLTIYLQNRIDSSNANDVGEELESIRKNNPADSLILDAEKLEYISSAGLRVVLRIRKEEPDMKIVNVSPEVYEIFDMTGFTEMITVEKAYRRLVVDGCEVIGQGANGKVYRLDPDTIIKVYFNPDALPDIHRERELARAAFVLGIPTAIPYDVVKVGEGYGSVFELLNAKSFNQLIAEEPEHLEHYIDLYVDLLKKIHSTEVKPGVMPSMKEVALNWAEFLREYLPADKADKLCALVAAVPESQNMLHGDYHTKNVMMQNGEVLLIDMDTLCVGNPVFEFASIYLAYCGYCALDHSIVEKFQGMKYETAVRIWEGTLSRYFGTEDPAVLNSYADRAMIVGYTRMMRRTIRRNGLNTPEGQALIQYSKDNLCQLLDRVDSLAF